MTYVPNSPTWADETGVGDGTPITAARLNHIEDGIVTIDTAVATNTAIIANRRVFAFFAG